jgi:predicted  nucleic acid-binding Zn-ribbon protein
VDAQASYKKLNAKLEATRPGEKRWGPEWMSAADADAKQRALAQAKSTITKDTGTIRGLDGQIADLEQQRNAVPHSEGDNNLTQRVAKYQRQIDALDAERTAAQKELDAAQSSLADVQPKWPDKVSVDTLALSSGG